MKSFSFVNSYVLSALSDNNNNKDKHLWNMLSCLKDKIALRQRSTKYQYCNDIYAYVSS